MNFAPWISHSGSEIKSKMIYNEENEEEEEEEEDNTLSVRNKVNQCRYEGVMEEEEGDDDVGEEKDDEDKEEND